jgi:hypothetical protein
MKNSIHSREQAITKLYTAAATLLKNSREVVALHEQCLKQFGSVPKPLDGEIRRIAAMRNVEELLNDPVQGVRGKLGVTTH